jgi:predicted nuclease with TOPRIM domain
MLLCLLQLAAATSKAADLQRRLTVLQADHSQLLSRLSDVTRKWQATVAQNQQLHQHNGSLTAQVADAQQQLALLQQECLHYKGMVHHQPQQQPHMQQQQQQ